LIWGDRLAFPPSDFRLLRFWSDDFPAARRLPAWTDVLSRMLLKAEVEPLTATPIQIDASLRALPGVHFGAGIFSACITKRTRAIAASDREGFYIIVNTEGPLNVRLPKAEIALDEGDACFLSCAEEAAFLRPTAGRLTCARVDSARMRALVPDIDDCGGLVIRRGNEALRLLTIYLRDMDDNQGLSDAELRTMVVNHIFNLMALVLHSAREAYAGALTPSGMKLRAIKRHIQDNLDDQDLSVARVASASRLSARQVQRLFESEDTTFSEYLLHKRLENVHSVLTDLRQAHRSISDIALAAGFGDVSYFNRTFRNHYGASPTAIRQSAVSRRSLPPMA
jgi:AraC-like DNA-binding protein